MQQLAFYRSYCSILYKRKQQSLIKEVGIGILASIIIILFYTFSPSLGNLLFIIYFLFVQITCMVDNTIFHSFKDYGIFGINHNNYHFKISFILSRIFLDRLITNLIIFLTTTIYLFIFLGASFSFFFILMVILNYLIMPSHNYLSIKLGESGSFIYIIMLIMLTSLIVLAYFLKFEPIIFILQANTMLSVLFLFCIGVLYVYFVRITNQKYVSRIFTLANKRGPLLWLKKINVFLFKDYVMNIYYIGFYIISCIATYTIIIPGSQQNLIPVFICLIMSGSIFTRKDKKQYSILHADSLFNENILTKDVKNIRKSKLFTISSGAIIKIMISFILLIIHKIFVMEAYIIISFILYISSLLEFITVYKNNIAITVMTTILKFSAIILFGLFYYFNVPYTVVFAYNIIILLYCLINIHQIMKFKWLSR